MQGNNEYNQFLRFVDLLLFFIQFKQLSSKNLCCLLNMHTFFNSFSTPSTISLIMLDLFSVRFSCSNNIYLSHISSKKVVESPEAIMAGDLSNLKRELSLVS